MAAGGAIIEWYPLGYRSSPEELPLLEFVKAHKARGDTYLLPVELPGQPLSNASPLSAQYGLAAGPAAEAGQVPLDLQRFRLHTGAPIVVDFKAIPYKDVEVLEWHERLRDSLHFYELVRAAPLGRRAASGGAIPDHARGAARGTA